MLKCEYMISGFIADSYIDLCIFLFFPDFLINGAYLDYLNNMKKMLN